MTSPETSKAAVTKSPIVKDSPTFGYIIGLSPIKPSNCQRISQVYESDVPSPQLVFKTPNFHCPKNSNLLDRSQDTVLNNSEYYSPGYANNTRNFSKVMNKPAGNSGEECTSGDNSPNQSCTSPSNCVDIFISDPMENGDNTFKSPEFCVKRDSKNIDNKSKSLEEDIRQDHTHSSRILVNEQTDDSKEGSNSIFLHCHPSKQDAYQPDTSHNDESTNLSLRGPYKSEEDLGIVSIAGEIIEINKEPVNKQMGPDSTIQNKTNSLVQHATDPLFQKAKDHEEFGKENSDTSELQLHQDSPHTIEMGDSDIVNSAHMSSVSTGTEIPYEQEEGAQNQRGKRKRLQFEASGNLTKTSINSFDYTTEATNKNSLIIIPPHQQISQSIPVKAKSGSLAMVDQSELYNESGIRAARPVGIGLHLNSLGKQILERNTSVQEGKTPTEDDCSISDNEKYLVMQQGNRILKQHKSFFSSPSPLSMEYVKISGPKFTGGYMTPCTNVKSITSEESTKSEESTQTSPQKKRKKAIESEGQKRCNCKKSKCLKLYCDCFAAGSYCSEACACRDCSNKEESEGLVRETRQQIESRNPLAFAPKVIVRVSDHLKASGDNKPIIPTSARHKRGCNCKKSLCLKKYCECFQAGVGCSLGCRCEGCKNTFGTKDGFEISEMIVEHKRLKEGGFERDLSSELENIKVKREMTDTKQGLSRFSPLTPLVHNSSGNDVPKPQPSSSCYYSSESVTHTVQFYEHSDDKSRPSSSISYTLEGDQNEMQIIPFSPGWDSLNLSPLLKTSPIIGGSSSTSKSGESKSLQMRLLQENGRISFGSVCWRSSPMTPATQFGESKFTRDPDSDMTLNSKIEDETPEILKEFREPIKSVKATSPNQKRVSPPHLIARDKHTKSPSSLRGVRKFVLQSVPFPNLTPYSKSNKEDGT